jgi:hypothetical protein
MQRSKAMKKIVLVAIGSLFVAGAASAADLPRPQPVYSQAPVGKAPIGKAPMGKAPLGKAPLVTKG